MGEKGARRLVELLRYLRSRRSVHVSFLPGGGLSQGYSRYIELVILRLSFLFLKVTVPLNTNYHWREATSMVEDVRLDYIQ